MLEPSGTLRSKPGAVCARVSHIRNELDDTRRSHYDQPRVMFWDHSTSQNVSAFSAVEGSEKRTRHHALLQLRLTLPLSDSMSKASRPRLAEGLRCNRRSASDFRNPAFDAVLKTRSEIAKDARNNRAQMRVSAIIFSRPKRLRHDGTT